MPVMRSMWPGINGNAAGSTAMVSNMRKRAVQASLFMVQMMQAPIYKKGTAPSNEDGMKNLDDSVDPSSEYESGEEGLAIRIGAEVNSIYHVLFLFQCFSFILHHYSLPTHECC